MTIKIDMLNRYITKAQILWFPFFLKWTFSAQELFNVWKE